jgi:hypothetical protein
MSRASRVPAVVLVALLAAVVGAACGPASRVDQAAAVAVATRVRGPSGSAAPGLPVVLTRETGVAELFGGFFLSSLTLFTACLADPPPAICRSGFRRTATSAADGAASFSLTGKDTQGFFGTAERFALSTRLPAGENEQAGPATTERFRIQSASVTVADLRLWHPAFSLSAAADARWDALPSSGYGRGSGYRVTFEDTPGAPVWTFESDGSQLRYDPRVLEDTTGGATVLAKRSVSGAEALYASARVAYTGTAGAPPSRGHPCQTEPVATPAPCPLTDGDFEHPLSPGAATATVDLGPAQPVSLVLVRGCACTVEASADGRAWTPIGTLAAADSSLVPSRTVSARYVRLRTGASLDGLREVSVWTGEASARGGGGVATGVGGAVVASGAHPSSSRTGWLVVAALLLGVVLGAGALVAVRARGR